MTNVLPSIFKGIVLFTPGGDLIYGIDPDKRSQWHQDLCLGLQEIWGLADSPHFLVPGYTATVERWLNPQTQKIEVIAEAHPPVERYIPLLQVLFNLEATTEWQIASWQEEHCNRAVIETYKPHFPQLWSQRDLIVRLDPQHSTRTLENSDRFDSTSPGDFANSRNGSEITARYKHSSSGELRRSEGTSDEQSSSVNSFGKSKAYDSSAFRGDLEVRPAAGANAPQSSQDDTELTLVPPKGVDASHPLHYVLRDETSPSFLAQTTPTKISQVRNDSYVLRLFISSDNDSAEKTLNSIHQLLEMGLGSPYTLKVIDLKKNPQQAEIHQIAVTPTLVRVSPQPVRRIVGQLDDIQRVLRIVTSFE